MSTQLNQALTCPVGMIVTAPLPGAARLSWQNPNVVAKRVAEVEPIHNPLRLGESQKTAANEACAIAMAHGRCAHAGIIGILGRPGNEGADPLSFVTGCKRDATRVVR